MDHPTDCLCGEVCAPISLPARTSSLQSAGTAELDVDLAQMVAWFRQFDERHKKLFIQMAACAVRVQGKRG